MQLQPAAWIRETDEMISWTLAIPMITLIRMRARGSTRVRPRGYWYGSRFRIMREEIERTAPEVRSTIESTIEEMMDMDPERYDAITYEHKLNRKKKL